MATERELDILYEYLLQLVKENIETNKEIKITLDDIKTLIKDEVIPAFDNMQVGDFKKMNSVITQLDAVMNDSKFDAVGLIRDIRETEIIKTIRHLKHLAWAMGVLLTALITGKEIVPFIKSVFKVMAGS